METFGTNPSGVSVLVPACKKEGNIESAQDGMPAQLEAMDEMPASRARLPLPKLR
jgi:hypothetical protein